MNPNNYTNKAMEVLQEAATIALKYNHNTIEPLHLAMALVQVENTVTAIIKKNGNNPFEIKKKLDQALKKLPQISGDTGDIHMNP